MSISTVEFDFFRTLVRRESAIVIEPGKEYLVESRLAPLATREGFTSLQELALGVSKQGSSDLQRKVIDAMTTNETSFFRDAHPFDVLQKTILPELIAARKESKTLNFWFAASSTGQEPYSVAMILKEHFPQLAAWQVYCLATDLSRDVLQRAESGGFSQLEVNRGLPISYLVKYFEKQGTEWRIKGCIRSMVNFQELNLIMAWPPMRPMDVVMIRNVLIYFDVETKKKILRKIREILKPDGYLFLGGAETTLNLDDHFERMPFERSGCYRLKRN